MIIRRLNYLLLVFLFVRLAKCHRKIPNQIQKKSNRIFCRKTPECIEKIQKMAHETQRFWFGDSWRINCNYNNIGNRLKTNSIECVNPRELSGFLSLGSRLFRVNTFTQDYLTNLRIFPKIKFSETFGSYRACDHDFQIQEKSEKEAIEGHPETDPLMPFQIHSAPPELSWTELSANDSFIVLMLDVGFGKLKSLAVDFPRDTKFIYEYEVIENFRLYQPTPLVVLIFELSRKSSPLNWEDFEWKDDQIFDLTQFMIDYQLEDGLIGMNWVQIGADPYAIERQRVKGLIDNCHALIQKKLFQEHQWKFVNTFDLNEIDSSLSISVSQTKNVYTACCQTIYTSDETLFADPLGNKKIASLAMLSLPLVTSLRSLELSDNYQRAQRHYIVLTEEKYSLVLFDPVKNYLYWMIVDIPAEALSSGRFFDSPSTATTIAPYVPPIPLTPNQCLFAVFILLKQPSSSEMLDFYNSDHIFRSRHCVKHCIYRNSFDIEKFKSFHRLHLSGINWIKVCYDLFEAARQIQIINQANISMSLFNAKVNNQKASLASTHMNTMTALKQEQLRKERNQKQIQQICAQLMAENFDNTCLLNNANPLNANSFVYLMSLLFILLNKSFMK